MNSTNDFDSNLCEDLSVVDPDVYSLCQREKERQLCGLEMIASENFTSKAVLQCLSSAFHNKYSEGAVGVRYYGGNEVVDEMETLCIKRSLAAYRLKPEEWGCNVQPYSGSPANFAVYTGLVEPNGRIMGLDLPDGGHLTHGFQTATKKISATSIFFQSMPYKSNPETGLIEYDELARNALLFRPKLIIAGMSCYSRNLDYKRFREIADSCGAILMADMAHISGLVAAGVVPSPFEFCDIVTTTTHKTLRGPRAGVIFYRKGLKTVTPKGDQVMYDFERKITEAVFPGLQGGPHNHAIAAIAVAMKLAQQPEYLDYQKQVVKNCQTLCQEFVNLGYNVVTGGSDNHLCLVNFQNKSVDGARVEKVLEDIHIAVNKNTCPGDKSALRPSGVRFGTPSLTSRGLKEKDIVKVADFIHRAVQIAQHANKKSTGTLLKDFKATLGSDEEVKKMISDLRDEVVPFAKSFGMPGINEY